MYDKPPWERDFERAARDRERYLLWEPEAWEELMHEASRVLKNFPPDIHEKCMQILADARRRGISVVSAAQEFRQAVSMIKAFSPPEYILKDPNAIPVRKPGFTKTPIQPLPEFFLIHFIGGPKSALEEFWEYKTWHETISQGKIFTVKLQQEPPTIHKDGSIELPPAISASYRATFIPTNETPFAQGCQVVVALYQE